MSSSLVLGDLLATEALGLRLLTGGPAALQRRIVGAHAIEIAAPARWLAPHWTMLTTGLALRKRPDAQRQLIEELDDARIGALGFGVGLSSAEVPAELLREAERREYPVFEIPLGTPFREVIAHVNRALVGADEAVYQRLPAIQRYLLDSLSSPDPETAVANRLASLVDATVLVYGEGGIVDHATGAAQTARVWQAIQRRPETHLAEFEVDGHHVVALPTVTASGGRRGWMAVYAKRPGVDNRLTKPAAQIAAPLLAAISRIDALSRDREQTQRTELLDALLADDAQDVPALRVRAHGFGIDFADEVHVVAVDAHEEAGATVELAAVRAALARALDVHAAPALSTGRESAVVMLVQLPAERLRALLGETLADHPGAIAGVSRPLQDVDGVAHGFHDARTAIRLGGDTVAFFVECDLSALLVSEAKDERVLWTISRRLDPLRDHPQLYDTLVSYFVNELDVGASARALHVHPNTLRYRLVRIEELLDRSLRHPATIAELHIALTTAPLRAEPPAGRRTTA